MSFVYGNFPMPGRPSSYLWLPPTADQSDGTLVDLPTRLGTPVVELIDVNDVGQLLVGLYDANSGVLGYYLLTPDEAAVDGYARLRLDTFNETLPQGGRFGGMIPTALNDLGQIVGDGGWSYDGGQTWRMHATLLTAVPEPGAVALAIVASFGLLARHRRL